ncbi:McrB family protein [Acinetobacter sp. YH12052]|uniref:McrB family protein n=1 Tax=Acinetobacter sp. YH12052 TaxID=2601055 RepID=UPI0015D407B4|nr:AAA family ATPase [Acinetobacter sp. YH12052]
MNNFQWIKVYQEICKALLHYKEDQKKLLEILWSCGVDKQFDKKVENGKEIKVDFEEVDPFTVLSLISYKKNKQSNKSRGMVQKALIEFLGKNNNLDIGEDLDSLFFDWDNQAITSANPNNKWYFPYKGRLDNVQVVERKENHIQTIWNFFERLVNNNEVKEEEFKEILNLDLLGITNLSIALSWIKPHEYIHLSDSVKKKYDLEKIKSKDWQAYKELLEKLKEDFGDKPMYEIQELIKNNGQSNNTDSNNSNSIKVPHPLNQILYGPAGTGKTYHTINHALAILDGRSIEEEQSEEDRRTFKEYLDEGRIKFVTFHQSYGYEEFVEGIRVETIKENPEDKNSKNILNYDVKPGIFKQICESARKNPKENYVLIIDEINRGNISKIFGELITLIEESKRAGKTEALPVTLPYSPEKPFSVPSNLYIIGTMNSSDRSLTSLDLALRRRFEFIEMLPDPTVLEDIIIGSISVKELLEIINKRIKALLDQDHCIGHANFTHLTSNSTVQDLMAVFEKKIIPLLQEYFFDDWEKINLVLGGNRMIIKDEIKKELFLGMMDENQIERLNSRSWIVNKELFKGKEDVQIKALQAIVSPQSKTNGDSA